MHPNLYIGHQHSQATKDGKRVQWAVADAATYKAPAVTQGLSVEWVECAAENGNDNWQQNVIGQSLSYL